jgi:F-type H+-transporting ATPase subunit epsilon
MAEPATKSLQITIVTPEKAVLDEAAEFVVLPLHDGELGVLPGRAAFVGQLGPGELRIKLGANTKRFFVDGGFVQVRSNTINVLTAGAKKPEELTDALVSAEKSKMESLPESNAVEKETKKRAALKVKGMEKVKTKA